MQDGLLLADADAVFDLVDQQHVSVVVFLQELEVEALVDVAFENGQDFLELAPVGDIGCGKLACSDYCLGEGLALLLVDIEGDLVSNQVVGLRVRAHELDEHFCSEFRPVKVELALCNLVIVVVAAATLLGLVEVEDHLEDLSSEVFGLDGLDGEGKDVAEELGCLV